jgi:hypothetical protein
MLSFSTFQRQLGKGSTNDFEAGFEKGSRIVVLFQAPQVKRIVKKGSEYTKILLTARTILRSILRLLIIDPLYPATHLFFFFFFFFAVRGLEHRTSCLLGRHSTT